MARPWSTAGSLIKNGGAGVAHENALKARGGSVVHLRLTPLETDKIDLAALNWHTNRSKAVRRLLSLALEKRLNEDWQ